MNRVVISLFLLSFVGCENESSSQLPIVKRLEEVPGVEFTPTLSSPVSWRDNIIYSSVTSLAWEDVRKALGASSGAIKTEYPEIKRLENARASSKSLESGEYSSNVETEGSEIRIQTSFEKVLSFEKPFQKIRESSGGEMFDFPSSRFGITEYDESLANQLSIHSYHKMDSFIIQLMFDDPDHDMIIAKGVPRFNTLSKAVNFVYKSMAGKKSANPYTYRFNPGDTLSVPYVLFNIEGAPKGLLNSTFHFNNRKRILADVKQRNGFMLTERGAKVESEIFVAVDSTSTPPKPPNQKKLLVEPPFLIIVKKKGNINPYYAIWIANYGLLD